MAIVTRFRPLAALGAAICISTCFVGCGKDDPAAGAFALLGPADNATDVALQPTLSWEDAEHAETCTLWLRAGDSAFGDGDRLVIDEAWTTSFVITSDLDRDITYHWRVAAHNAVGDTQCTADFSFTTIPEEPGAFALTAPADSATDVALQPTLTWADSTGAETYTLWRRADNDSFEEGDRLVIDEAWTTSHALDTDLDRDTTYHWRVVARNTGGDTQCTADFSFTTIPEVPTIIAQPAHASVTEGQAADFAVTATGGGTLAYQWSRSDDGGTTWAEISGANEASYSIAFAAVEDDGAVFRCAVTNAGGEAVSGMATLTVTEWDGAWRVDAAAQAGGDGLSWSSAIADLQDALDAASDGQEIWVATGTYVPTDPADPGDARTATFQLKTCVGLYGGFAGTESERDERDWEGNATILCGDIGVADDSSDNAYHVVLGADGATLDGFTVTNGNADGTGTSNSWQGGGMRNTNASPTIVNCTFELNSAAYYGGGIINTSSSSPVITNCLFTGNTSVEGGAAIFNDGGSAVIADCVFESNTADNPSGWATGGAIYSSWSDVVLTNCLFAGNIASGGGGFSTGGAMHSYGSDLEVVNCTFAGNEASYQGGAFKNDQFASATLTNCILWDNTAPSGQSISNDGEVFVSYSCVAGGWTGDGNIDVLPRFTDALNGDYSLQPTSPCIDTGTNAPYEADGLGENVLTDIAGAMRIMGDPQVADMGAYEAEGAGLAVTHPTGGERIVPAEATVITWMSNQVSTVDIELSTDGGQTFTAIASGIASGGSHAWTPSVLDGSMNCLIRVADSASGPSATSLSPFAVAGENVTVHVDASAPEGGDGLSWANPITSVANGLNVSRSGDEVRVASGTYKPTETTNRLISFRLVDGAALRGGYEGHGAPDGDVRDTELYASTLSGDIGVIGTTEDNSYHVVLGANGATIDGFRIIDGRADGKGSKAWGGGLLSIDCDLLVTDCIFDGNWASSRGGGMNSSGGSLTVTGCSFTVNRGGSGGGIYLDDSSSLYAVESEFAGNIASNAGGGISGFGSLTVVNSSFDGNEAGWGGGGIRSYGGNLLVINSAFTDNMGDSCVRSMEDQSAELINCTIAGSSGNGFEATSTNATLTNCISWGNAAAIMGTATVTYSCVEGGHVGDGNTDQDPLFVDAAGGDYRLQSGSPCIDNGTDAPFEPGGAAQGVTTDLDGQARLAGSYVDMGAYEYQPD